MNKSEKSDGGEGRIKGTEKNKYVSRPSLCCQKNKGEQLLFWGIHYCGQ